jgi:hypothetical protein
MRHEVDNSGCVIPIAIIALILFILGGIIISMWLYPKYSVYCQRLEGEGLLAHAQASKEVAVAEAKAKMESATLLAEAEVVRAGGVARANQIIGDSLKGNESYLRYLYIQALADKTSKEIIYVPTEACLPILEAGKR